MFDLQILLILNVYPLPISPTHQPLDNYRSSLFLMLVFPFLTSVT